MKILIACEFSGVCRDAFLARGHDVMSCDILPTESPGPHYQGDVREILGDGWDLMIAHPACTYLTNAGVRHLHDHVTTRKSNKAKISGSKRWVALQEAAAFFKELLNAPIPKIAVENPIPHKYAKNIIGNYSQLIQPWQHGHGETKATCIWLKNLPLLTPTNIVDGRVPRIHLMPPGPNRGHLRSITYSGIGKAFAAQWG